MFELSCRGCRARSRWSALHSSRRTELLLRWLLGSIGKSRSLTGGLLMMKSHELVAT